MVVDYDTDDGGLFRAKTSPNYAQNTSDVLEDSKTKIEMPIDLIEAREVTVSNLRLPRSIRVSV